MNYVTRPDPFETLARQIDEILSEPTLEQRLRYIDLTFECHQQARDENVASQGPLYASPFDNEGPSERSQAIGKRASQLRLAAMIREGLPLSLLAKVDRERMSDDELVKHSADQRRFVRMSRGRGL